MDANELIKNRIKESINVKEKILNSSSSIKSIDEAKEIIKRSLLSGGKILFCGNGGSASDALHLTAEFVGRFQKERGSLPAICLNADVASITSISNDYGYKYVFSRMAEGLMKDNDVLIGISTSGESENVRIAMENSNKNGKKTIALLGKDGGSIKDYADVSIVVPCDNTARIQESHIMIGHIICELVENEL